MKISLALSLAVAVVSLGCAAPQYTVMNADSSQTTTNATGPTGPSSWPDVGDAEASGEQSNDVAVIIAIEDYAFLPDVAGAVDNANAWENYFRKQRGMSDVFVLTDKQAPIEEIKRFAAQAAATAPEGSQLWFIFIGHGAALKDGTDGALIGMDAQQTMESIGSRSLARKELLAMLNEGKQAQTVVVLDTCFSGRDAGGELLAQGTQPVIPVNAAPQLASGTVVLSAAGNDEVAGQLPGSERPAFSYLLLGALRGWADDGDGNVTADEAITWTRQQLRHAKGRQQTPAADGDNALTLARNATEKDPGISILMKGGGPGPAATANDDAATSPANAEGGTVIDTNKGLVFVKPDEWGIGPAGMGIVLNLQNQYSGNAIVASRMKMKQAHAAGMLGLPQHYEDDTTKLEVLRQPEPATYGPNKGRESEFKIVSSDPDFQGMGGHHIKFGTYQDGAAWSIELVINDPNSRDADYEAFKAFLEGARFQ